MHTDSANIMRSHIRARAFLAMLLMGTTSTVAHSAAEPTVLMGGLADAQAMTIQRGTNNVLIAMKDGRIARLAESEMSDLLTGLAEGPKAQTPASICMVGPTILAAATNGLQGSPDQVVIFEVPEAGKPAIKASAAIRFDLPAGYKCRGITATSRAILVAAIDTEQNATILQLPIRKADLLDHADGYGELQPRIATGLTVADGAPVRITTTPTGELLASCALAESPNRIVYFRMTDGQPLVSFALGETLLVDLAYSKRSREQSSLYAVGRDSAGESGLFRLKARLIDGLQRVETVKVAALDEPTSLAFGSDGSVYVIERGTPGETTGRVLKFEPLP